MNELKASNRHPEQQMKKTRRSKRMMMMVVRRRRKKKKGIRLLDYSFHKFSEHLLSEAIRAVDHKYPQIDSAPCWTSVGYCSQVK